MGLFTACLFCRVLMWNSMLRWKWAGGFIFKSRGKKTHCWWRQKWEKCHSITKLEGKPASRYSVVIQSIIWSKSQLPSLANDYKTPVMTQRNVPLIRVLRTVESKLLIQEEKDGYSTYAINTWDLPSTQSACLRYGQDKCWAKILVVLGGIFGSYKNNLLE